MSLTPEPNARRVATRFSVGRRTFLPRDSQNSVERRIVDTIGMIAVLPSR